VLTSARRVRVSWATGEGERDWGGEAAERESVKQRRGRQEAKGRPESRGAGESDMKKGRREDEEGLGVGVGTEA
jgi:hypothetical protein